MALTFAPLCTREGVDPVMEVVSPDEITLKLCPEGFRDVGGASCVEPEATLNSRFFRHQINDTIRFDVVMFDGEGHEVIGLPEDFTVSLPEGWEDARDDVDRLGRTSWRTDAGTPREGAIRVTGFGREMHFLIDPTLYALFQI